MDTDAAFLLQLLLLMFSTCKSSTGRPIAADESVILSGGDDAKPNSWPWQALIMHVEREVPTYRRLCGGTLISPEWVLTAAHCIEHDPDPSHYKVILGEHNIRDQSDREQIFHVSQFIKNEEWNPRADGSPKDIGLIRLAVKATLNICVQTLTLPAGDERLFTADCWITGWGATHGSPHKIYPDVLQEAPMTILNNSDCAHRFLKTGHILDSHICVYNPTAVACFGDSGGPLSCRMTNGQWILAGVTSWGTSQCKTMPAVYTRVTYYLDWIHRTMGMVRTDVD